MNQTEHYQLSQWDGTDRILRSDFNADNRKIDEALAEIKAASPYAKIKEMIVDSAVSQVSMDVSDIDFSQYRRIEADVLVPAGDGTLQLRTNGLTSGYHYTSTDTSSSATTTYLGTLGGIYLCHFSPPRAGKPVGCWNTFWNGYGDTHFYCISTVNWDDLSSFDFSRSSGSLPEGTRISLYGVKL